MKKVLLIACTAILSFGCNDKSGSATTSVSDSTKISETMSGDLVYPYTLDEPYKDWQPGNKQHAVTAMNSLKGFETGDMNACMAGFGDSVEIRFDYFQQKFSNDSLRAFFTTERAKYSDIKVKMGDWESVISSDKKSEYVTMWYKQIMTDKNGKTDSLAVINDFKIVNGKIVELDEKIQHYPAKK